MLALMLSACVTQPDNRDAPARSASKSAKKSPVKVDVINVEPELAQHIAEQYLAQVAAENYNGQTIVVEACDDTPDDCDYRVSHWGNGCAWSSDAVKECSETACHYRFTYNASGPVICE